MFKYIDCAVGTEPQCSIWVGPHGDLVRLKLDSIPIDFTREAFLDLCEAGKEILRANGWKDPEDDDGR